jgi:hypothetical protein
MSETVLGEPVPRGRGRRRLFVVGLFVALLGLGAFFLVALFVSRGLENGPRWLAANYLVLEIAVLLTGSGGTLMAVAQPKGGYVLLGLVSAFLVIVVAFDVPSSTRDAFGPFERRSLDIVEWTVEHNGTAVVRTTSGETYRWAEAFGVLTYPRMTPGRYEVVLTSERHRIVGATRVD